MHSPIPPACSSVRNRAASSSRLSGAAREPGNRNIPGRPPPARSANRRPVRGSLSPSPNRLSPSRPLIPRPLLFPFQHVQAVLSIDAEVIPCGSFIRVDGYRNFLITIMNRQRAFPLFRDINSVGAVIITLRCEQFRRGGNLNLHSFSDTFPVRFDAAEDFSREHRGRSEKNL